MQCELTCVWAIDTVAPARALGGSTDRYGVQPQPVGLRQDRSEYRDAQRDRDLPARCL